MTTEVAAFYVEKTNVEKFKKAEKPSLVSQISKTSKQINGDPLKDNSSTPSTTQAATCSDPPLTMSLQLNVIWTVMVGLSLGTRLWQLSTPKHVVFDEVHFGKFTNFFMQHKYFFDVHPPLGKLLFAVTAYLSGYDGNFSFDDIGQDLGEYEFHVSLLRFVPAFLGGLIAPCIYEIVLELGCTQWTAGFAAFLIIFENMLVVQSKFIFLDGQLLFFSIASVLCYLKFRKQSNRVFSSSWWSWLVLTGLSLTAACSTKYTGVMTLLVVGTMVALDYWKLIGDSSIPARDLTQHLVARGSCLGIMPILLYLLQFYVLFALIYKTGPHDDMMSSAFQASLEGGLAKITQGQAEEVAYGSQITLRHTHGKQCWLHSHPETYPVKYPDGRGSSAQQQVTCYSFKDVNNWWIVKDPHNDSLNVDWPPRPVKNGEIIQLIHGISGRALNSHDVAAPLSPTNQEVSCYIDYNISMHAQNLWRLEIVNPDGSGIWKTIQSQVRLVHLNTSQAVKITGLQLPDWGFHQFEVATDRVINQQDTVWNVEEHQQNISYRYVPEKKDKTSIEQQAPQAAKPMAFFPKFLEMQWKMIQSNKELSGEHTFSSTPSQWPIMKRGVAYWIHRDKNMQIYCLGNPLVWWAGSLSVLAYGGLLVIYLLRRRRAVNDLDQESWERFVFVGELLVGGYLVHYLPFFPMERTLFIHHYLNALLFKIILLAVITDHVYKHVFTHHYLRYAITAGCSIYVIVVMATFYFFSPVTYGHVELSSAQINQRKWLRTWDMLSHPNT
ncbi:predicted protein [Nematostella vectensis]|uniref:dolichyl-phosphate-mannose--protein mannosyltransferase n=1 Tax=Nematostella vectensis TaxID=45351 RepID=A7SZW5_NEMVE|nr:predicted protein [Nematostella vectensis]|eukprot:XP_001622853.1 predicted protein [Nematostella vectensis]